MQTAQRTNTKTLYDYGDGMDNIRTNIEKFGWHFLYIFDPEGNASDFSYSVGFEESYNHPEIIVFGLKKDTAHHILSDIADELKNGKTFNPNERLNDVIGGDMDVLFKPVQEEFHSEYLGLASKYYQKSFRAMVMFWPNKQNILPTEGGCDLTIQDEALKIV
ncbi:DUF4262 domain-containing protein [Shewanella sp. YLB-09]|nr:DUF4262 domain-containing protein [Shewanella sp. YLB-09]